LLRASNGAHGHAFAVSGSYFHPVTHIDRHMSSIGGDMSYRKLYLRRDSYGMALWQWLMAYLPHSP
jgi:hypothetical protein